MYKYEAETTNGPCRFSAHDGIIVGFDPSGGPMIEIGYQCTDELAVAAIREDPSGVFFYLIQNDEEFESRSAEYRKICIPTKTSGSALYITEEFDLSKKILVGMIGRAGSGKDTVADYLCDKFSFSKLAFADPLKKAVQVVFDIPDDFMFDREKREMELPHWPGWSTRKFLQFVGTELFRNQVDQDVWVKNAVSRASRGYRSVISDVRFPNEVDRTTALLPDDVKCVFIRVTRPDHDGAASGIKGHASEAHIDELNADIDILNDGTLEDLYVKIDSVMSEILK